MLSSNSFNFKRELIFLFLALLIFLLPGCGSTGQPSAVSGQGGEVTFTPYPPMPNQPSQVSGQQSGVSKSGFTLNLNRGWTTISFPFNSLSSTAGFSHEIQYYQAGQYFPLSSATAAPSIDCCKGYWAYQDPAAAVIINGGSGPAINSITLSSGWNLIGFPFSAAKNFSELSLTFNNQTKPLTEACSMDTDAGSQWLYGNIEYYKSNRWYTLKYDRDGSSALSPGVGYWVFSWEDGMALNFVPPVRNEGPWVKTWGTEDYEYGTAATVDLAGNIYAAGQGNGYSYLLKYDPWGDLLWQKGWGGNKFAAAWAVTSDQLGNVYLAGDTNIGSSRLAAFLTKFSPSGNILWERTWRPTDGWARISALGCDPDGNIIAAGYTNGFEEDVLLLKYSPSGNLIWADSWGDHGLSDYADALAIDSDGNIFLAGSTSSGDLLDSQVLLLEFDSLGNLTALKTWGGDGFDCAYALALDPSANLYLAGIQADGADAFLLKYDPNLSLQWQQSWSEGGFCQGQALQVDGSGRVYLGVENYLDSGATLALLQYDGDGTAVSENSWHSQDGNETLGALAIDGQGNLFLQGYVYSAGSRWQPEAGSKAEAAGEEGTLDLQPLIADGSNYRITNFGLAISGSQDFAGGSDNVLIKYVPNYQEPAPRPQLLQISPGQGACGSTVTISGNNLGDEGSITFAGFYAQILNWSSSQVICVVPGEVGLGEAEVVAGSNNQLSNPLSFTVIGPQVDTLTPSAGPVGSRVTIDGANFGATGTVSFDTGGAEVLSWSENRVICLVPSRLEAGTAQVTVTAYSKTSNSQPYTVEFPVITGIDPDSEQSGNQVTLSGTNFGDVQGTVTFAGFPAELLNWNDTRIVCRVSYVTPSGSIKVKVTAANNCPSNEFDFTVLAPQITGLSPSQGPVGTTVTVTGLRFGDSGTIRLMDQVMSQISWSDTQIVCVIPALGATGPIIVTSNGKDSNMDQTFTVEALPDAPIVTEVNPKDETPGTTVTISGSNFGNQRGTVFFGNTPAEPADVWAPTMIVCMVPVGQKKGWVVVMNEEKSSLRIAWGREGVVPASLLCHFDGTYIDATGRHSLGGIEGAGHSAAYPKFGTGAASLSCHHGEGDPIPEMISSSIDCFGNSDDWNFGTGDFTIDFWVRGQPGSYGALLSIGKIVTEVYPDFTWDRWVSTLDISFAPMSYYGHQWNNLGAYLGAGLALTNPDGTMGSGPDWIMWSDYANFNMWHHVALLRHDNYFGFAKDGCVWGWEYDTRPVWFDPAAHLRVGEHVDVYVPGGWSASDLPDQVEIDELRVIKGKCLWSDNFNPPNEAGHLNYYPLPSLGSLDVDYGYEGSFVTLSGYDFGDYQGAGGVSFGGVASGTALYWSDDEIIAQVPEDGQSGEITVTSWSGGVSVEEYSFTVFAPVYLPGGDYFYRTWGGPGDESVHCQTVDSSGNLYLLGAANGDGPENAGWGDHIFLLKYDPNGVLLWQKAFQNGDPNGVTVDQNYNVLITGRNFVAKFNSAGNMIWQRQWKAQDNGFGCNDVGVDKAGNVYLAADYWGDSSNNWMPCAAVCKISPAGTLLWQRVWRNSRGNSIAVDAEHNVIYLGGCDQHLGYENYYSNYSFLAKLEPENGRVTWMKTFAPTSDNWSPSIQKILLDPSGNVYTLGTAGWWQMICKFDPNGNLYPGWPQTWEQNLFAGSGFNDMAVDGHSVYLLGWENGKSFPDGSFTFDNENTLLVKFNSDGNLVYSRTFNKDKTNDRHNHGVAINVGNYGKLYLACWISDDNQWDTVWNSSNFKDIQGYSISLPIHDVPSGLSPMTPHSWLDTLEGTTGDVVGEQTFYYGYAPDVLLQRLDP